MMQAEIKEAFEKCITEQCDSYFIDPDFTLASDGDYQDPEIYGAFLAFEVCWNTRPAMGMFLDVVIGKLEQPTDKHGAPTMNFGTQLYHLPPGNYTIHAVQRLADQSAEDVVKQLSEQTA